MKRSGDHLLAGPTFPGNQYWQVERCGAPGQCQGFEPGRTLADAGRVVPSAAKMRNFSAQPGTTQTEATFLQRTIDRNIEFRKFVRL